MWQDLSKSFTIVSALRITGKDFSPPNGTCYTGLSLSEESASCHELMKTGVRSRDGGWQQTGQQFVMWQTRRDVFWCACVHTHIYIYVYVIDCRISTFLFTCSCVLLFPLRNLCSWPGGLTYFQDWKLSQPRIITCSMQLCCIWGMASPFSFSFIFIVTHTLPLSNLYLTINVSNSQTCFD